MSNKKLFVGSLPISTTKKRLVRFFSKFGDIKKIAFVKQSNHSRKGMGFIFLTFSDLESTWKVLAQPIIYEGRKLTISEALSGKKLKNYRQKLTERRLFVSGLPLHVDDSTLDQIFKEYGEIEKAYTIRNNQIYSKYQHGYILFQNSHSIEKCIESEIFYRGSRIMCQKYDEQKKNREKQYQQSSKIQRRSKIDFDYTNFFQGDIQNYKNHTRAREIKADSASKRRKINSSQAHQNQEITTLNISGQRPSKNALRLNRCLEINELPRYWRQTYVNYNILYSIKENHYQSNIKFNCSNLDIINKHQLNNTSET